MHRCPDRRPAVLVVAILLAFFGAPASIEAPGPGRALAVTQDPGGGGGAAPTPPPVGAVGDLFEVVDARSLPLEPWLPLQAALRSAGGTELADVLAGALGLEVDSGLLELRRNVDSERNVHIRYQQTYGGVPIWGEHLVLHVASDGDAAATGRVIRRLDDRVRSQGVFRTRSAGFSAADALAIAREARGHTGPGWELQRESVEEMILLADGDVPREIYAVDYYAEEDGANPTRPFVLVDARSGDVVAQWEGLAHANAVGPGGNLKTGRYVFGTDYGHLDVTQAGATCTMLNARVRTVNLNHGDAGSAPFAFTCPENLFKEINGAFSPLNDAHFFGSVVHSMYSDWLGVAPLTFTITLRVHYEIDYENAFWDGAVSTFGDGSPRFHPLVGANVVSHEISHGFTEQNSGLVYADQSGGINEAFSDIAGEAAELYWKGSVDWLVGSEMTKLTPALRYFEDPTRDGASIGHARDYRPELDVHASSGVFNRAFFLLANTPGWTVRTAFEVFAHANQNQWTPNASFQEGACGVLESAKDLNRNVREVDAAFQAVGVDCGYLPFIDEDGDGMDDIWETSHGLDPSDPGDAPGDPDGDGLSNLEEYLAESDPADPDTDGDGLSDGDEVHDHRTDPADADTDADGLPDGAEVDPHGTDPLDADTDDDGLSDGGEVVHGTDPHEPDTDGDGMPDGFEVTYGFDPITDGGEAGGDADGDGLSNLEEFSRDTNPRRADTDDDGLSDGAEVRVHGTDPLLPDTDGDRMTDGWEVGHGLDPRVDDASGDLDGDGFANFVEFDEDTDPANPASRPPSLDAYAIGEDDRLYRIELRSGEATAIGELGESGAFTHVEGLAFTPDGTLHAVTTTASGRLLRIDPATGRATLVGSLGMANPGNMGLAGDELGMLWMMSSYAGSLHLVDPETGATMRVGSSELFEVGSLAWDGSHFYAIEAVQHELYRIDRTSGAVTLVGPVGGVPLGAIAGLTTDGRGRLWGITAHGGIFRIDKQTAEATSVSTTSAGFHSIALDAFPDADGDGMPDFWERTYELDADDPSDAATDPDRDGLTSLQEFAAGAHPRNADTDGDDLTDGQEVSTLGTNPTRLDSDADGISDGSEVYEQRTDPRDADTDDDGMHDRWELTFRFDPRRADAAGDADADGATNVEEFLGESDPRNSGSRPIGLRAWTIDRNNHLHRVELLTGRTTPIGPLGITGDIESLAVGPDHQIYAVTSGSASSLYRVDPDTGAATRIGSTNITANRFELEFDDRGRLWMTVAASQGLFQMNTSTGRTTKIANLSERGIQALAFDGESLLGLRPDDDGLYRIDRQTGEATLVGPLVHVSLAGRTGLTADTRRRLWGLDQESVFRVDPATGRATRVSTLAGEFTSIALDFFVDADGDGMPDFWENLHGLNEYDPTDAVADGDADGLANAAEHAAGTHPARGDTDGDGLGDGAEIASHGTDPADPDTDSDGIPDGFELDVGLDPRAYHDGFNDPDRDGWTNYEEYRWQTDLLDSASQPGARFGYAVTTQYLYEIELLTGASRRVGALGVRTWLDGLTFGPGRWLYAVERTHNELFRIDRDTGAATLIGNLGVSVFLTGLAYDGSTLWMVAEPPFETESSLFRVDVATGVATHVGDLGGVSLDSLAWDGNALYGIEPNTQGLYRVDRASGSATFLGTLGITPFVGSGLDTDRHGRLIGLAFQNGDGLSEVFRVDKATGVATLLAEPRQRFLQSLAIDSAPGAAAAGVPAPIPALPGWAIALLVALLGGSGVSLARFIRRQ